MSPLRLPTLPLDPSAPFPDPTGALADPDGLLCMGGDLAPGRLRSAYRHGIFPWYSGGQPILWWSPAERMVFRSDGVHLARRFRRQLRQSNWDVRIDTAFEVVMAACAHVPRPGQHGTWITREMQTAYARLHALGRAHSIEVFDGDRLVGGLYGVSEGRMFFAESMFSLASGGSKVALAALGHHLGRLGWGLFDAQVDNEHLRRMGGQLMPRDTFLAHIATQIDLPTAPADWQVAPYAARELGA